MPRSSSSRVGPRWIPTRIGGLGLSVSGEMLLQAAAESPKLAAVVSEGAGTRTLSEKLEDFSDAEVVPGLPRDPRPCRRR